MDIKNVNLNKYCHNAFGYVEGWCEWKLFEVFDFLDSLPVNKSGGICEIGVHHGKFYMMLNQLVEENEKSYAVDVFENQHLNIDSSGQGNKDAFLYNLELYDKFNGTNTIVVTADSTDTSIKLNNIIKPGTLKFFSIDGGHTAEHTINDLHIANELINNEGIVIVDDISNHGWLGVMEGVCKYIQTYPTLVPVAVGFNKMLFVKLSFKEYYYNAFNGFGLKDKESKFFGHKIIVLS